MYFEMMNREYGMTPNVVHQNCVVDMLSRAGKVEEAMALMRSMPFRPDGVAWKTVLRDCHRSASLELGQWAFEHLSHLSEGDDAAAFTLMSNLYANAGMHRDASATKRKKQAKP
jgi:pentatricopeptide repeat protein